MSRYACSVARKRYRQYKHCTLEEQWQRRKLEFVLQWTKLYCTVTRERWIGRWLGLILVKVPIIHKDFQDISYALILSSLTSTSSSPSSKQTFYILVTHVLWSDVDCLIVNQEQFCSSTMTQVWEQPQIRFIDKPWSEWFMSEWLLFVFRTKWLRYLREIQLTPWYMGDTIPQLYSSRNIRSKPSLGKMCCSSSLWLFSSL